MPERWIHAVALAVAGQPSYHLWRANPMARPSPMCALAVRLHGFVVVAPLVAFALVRSPRLSCAVAAHPVAGCLAGVFGCLGRSAHCGACHRRREGRATGWSACREASVRCRCGWPALARPRSLCFRLFAFWVCLGCRGASSAPPPRPTVPNVRCQWLGANEP